MASESQFVISNYALLYVKETESLQLSTCKYIKKKKQAHITSRKISLCLWRVKTPGSSSWFTGEDWNDYKSWIHTLKDKTQKVLSLNFWKYHPQ